MSLLDGETVLRRLGPDRVDLVGERSEPFADERHVGEPTDGVAGSMDRLTGPFQALADAAQSIHERAHRDTEHEPRHRPQDHEQVDRDDGPLGQARFDRFKHPENTLPRRVGRQTPDGVG